MAQSKLTRAARNQECTIRLHPYCNGNIETTVLAHAPSPDKGMGIKSPDWWGAFSCSDCHDIVDGRKQVKDIEGDEIYRRHIEGVFLTNKILRSMGLVK